jgi:hypothetical protein
MGNVFQTEARMHRKFDLKGSTHGRTAGARTADPAAILKARARRRAPQACAPAGSGLARDAPGAAGGGRAGRCSLRAGRVVVVHRSG